MTRAIVSLETTVLCSIDPRAKRHLLSREIGDVNEGIVETGVDVSNAEVQFAFRYLRAEADLFLFGDLLTFAGTHSFALRALEIDQR